MIKCTQCEKPAYFSQPQPLCVQCADAVSRINERLLERLERESNAAHNDIYRAIGLTPPPAPFPDRAPVPQIGSYVDNRVTSNGPVGLLNTGSMTLLNSSISTVQQGGDPAFAHALESLRDQVASSADLTNDAKAEVLETLSFLAEQSLLAPNKRIRAVAESLFKSASRITSSAKDISDICKDWWPVIGLALGFATAT